MFRRKILSAILLIGLLIGQSVPRALAATYCDQAEFVSDITAPDGANFAPGAAFVKTWRFKNIGTCTWSTSYGVVFAGGDQLSAPLSVALPANVPPGQMLDISVAMTAPMAAGHYKALWKFKNTSNVQFGIGSSASDAFWVDINVVETNAVIYDFVANAPYAQWKSGAGLLPFPGTSGDSRGFAYQVTSPHLEDDSFDSSPGLLTVPQYKYNGYIQATYPEFQVQSGDKLQTLVNCEFGANSCYVTFRIDYLNSIGAQRTLWSWKEAQDKRFYRASIDLSSLAGQKVRFVFMLLATGFASGDRAIWGSPRIVRTGPPQPPATLTPLPALTATSTPLTPPPPTVAPSGCDKASFVTDVTVPDGTIFSPGAAFTKTWRLKNAGACTWTTAYKLMYYSGEQMGAPTAINLPWNVFSGQQLDISINLVAPSAAGKYRGFWILSNASGGLFGIGTNAADPIWAEINVAGDSPINTGYDFVANVCSAQWKSGAGILPCPGTDGSSSGFVLKLDTPQLEDGSTGAPSLVTFPQNRYNGYIQGYYPTFTVQPGDRFQTTIGCAFGSSCYVTYRLDYMNPNGWIGTFWQWREQNEGRVYNASIDLSPLAGRSVRFILTILATGYATNDRAIWTAPRIVRAGSTIPTATPTVTTSDWLTYTNNTYGFQFKYPKEGVIVSGGNDNFTRINLPFAPGTNLKEKYLEVIVRENVNPCQSPLQTNHPPETVTINGISFLKQTGDEGAAGNRYQWIAYSTLRNNACISMDFILHSLDPGAFATPIPVFDFAAETTVIPQMMSTFGWLAPVPTPTFTSTPITVPGTIVPSPRIRSLSMLDASNGWAIGESYLLRTVDGGVTWYNVTMPGVSSFSGAFFKDSNAAWVLTALSPHVGPGSLYRTTDGGLTWVHYDVPFNNGGIQFLDNTHGFVLSSLGVAMNKEAVAIYQTSDGGATWVRKFHNDPTIPGAGTSLPLGGHKNGITFRDATTGWIGGETPAAEVYLYKTADSGATWALQHVAFPTGYESPLAVSTTAPTFFGANDAVLPVWITTGSGRDLFIYTSHDGGATWSPTSSFARNVGPINFVSIKDAIGWDWANVFHVTNDSGNTWRQVTPNVLFGDDFRGLDFVSTTTGWVFQIHEDGSTSLYRTADGGSTWTLLFGNTPTPNQLPDLTISQMRIELQNTSCLEPGDSLGVRVWVTNNGQAPAGDFVLKVNNIEQTVNGLNIGETKAIFFAGNINNPVTAMVDSTSAIPEGDENNNARSEMVPVPTAPLPCATSTPTATQTPEPFPQDFPTFGQTLVDAMNARNFDLMKALMDQSFGISFWQSQGTAYTPDQAIDQLRNSYQTLIPNPNQDLYALMGGLNPYSIMGLSESNSKGLFVSGWGPNGSGEAILYMTRLPDGSLFWHSILIAPTGFILPVDPVSHEAFCADSRVPALIEQLKGSVNQSNGDMFALLASPAHGIDVRLWAYQPAVNYNASNAYTVYISTQIYDWGAGHISGIPDVGTFKDIIQPKLLDVLNAPNMERYCDDLTKVYPLANPWPYPNMRFYNLYKPSSSPQSLDFRTWLVGFEYVNGQPYIAALVTIIAEP